MTRWLSYKINRLCYRLLYFTAECGIRAGSDIVYGFSRFPKPSEVLNSELDHWLDELEQAIKTASPGRTDDSSFW